MLSCFRSNIHKWAANVSDLISFKPYSPSSCPHLWAEKPGNDTRGGNKGAI